MNAPDALSEIALALGPLGLGSAWLAVRRPRTLRLCWLVTAVALFVAHELLLTRFLWQLPNAVAGSPWNWTGKALALAGTLSIAALPCLGYRHSGFTVEQSRNSGPAWAFSALLCGAYVALAAATTRAADCEAVLFMWTMPGLEEESFYRGIFLLALSRASGARGTFLGVSFGWAGLMTIATFGAVHGLSFANGGPRLDLARMAVPTLFGAAMLWLRVRTRSILAPVLCHSVADGIGAAI